MTRWAREPVPPAGDGCRARGPAKIVGAALVAWVVAGCTGPAAERAQPLVARVEVGAFTVTVPARGRVAPVEEAIVSAPEDMNGVGVAEVAAEGTRLASGAMVLSLDLDQRRRDLDQTRRELERAGFELAKLDQQHDAARAEGEAGVRAKELSLQTAQEKLGILLAGPPTERLEAQRLMVEAGKASEVEQRRRVAQEAALESRGFSSQLSYLDALAELGKARLRRASAGSELRRLRGGPRRLERTKLDAEAAMMTLETTQSVRAHQARLEVQRLERDQKRLEEEAKRAALAREERVLARGVLLAPTTGVVVHSLYGEPGRRVNPGEPVWESEELVRVVDLSRFEVEARLAERDVDLVGEGARARVRFPAVPGLELEGKVGKIGQFAVAAEGGGEDDGHEFTFTIVLPPGGHGLRPNLSALASIELTRIETGWRVVEEAVECAPAGADSCTVAPPELTPVAVAPAGRDGTWTYFRGPPLAPALLLRPGPPVAGKTSP